MPAKLENLGLRLVEHNPEAQHNVGLFFDKTLQRHQQETDVGHARKTPTNQTYNPVFSYLKTKTVPAGVSASENLTTRCLRLPVAALSEIKPSAI